MLNTKAIDTKYKFAIMKKIICFSHNHSVTIAVSNYEQQLNSSHLRCGKKNSVAITNSWEIVRPVFDTAQKGKFSVKIGRTLFLFLLGGGS